MIALVIGIIVGLCGLAALLLGGIAIKHSHGMSECLGLGPFLVGTFFIIIGLIAVAIGCVLIFVVG